MHGQSAANQGWGLTRTAIQTSLIHHHLLHSCPSRWRFTLLHISSGTPAAESDIFGQKINTSVKIRRLSVLSWGFLSRSPGSRDSALLTYSLCKLTCGEDHQRRSMCKYYQSFLGRGRYGCDVGSLIYSSAESAAVWKMVNPISRICVCVRGRRRGGAKCVLHSLRGMRHTNRSHIFFSCLNKCVIWLGCCFFFYHFLFQSIFANH